MSEDAWQEGQRAWGRLAEWFRSSSVPGDPDDGDRALKGLADLGLVRRLLDQAEFEAVRTARRHGKSWAEIAIRLGVTRQSAWERWRDVEEAPGTAERDAGRGLADEPRVREQAIRLRERSLVTVPNVIGMSWGEAWQVLHTARLVGMGPDPDTPALDTLRQLDSVVTDQSPESGAQVPPGSPVTLWLDSGGGTGVREPRRPKPDPDTGRKMRDEITDEAVG
jgi:hypothetical protein